MRAAGMALPFEHPRLSVIANIGNADLGDRLDRAIARSAQSSRFNTPVIEAKAAPVFEVEAPPDHSIVPSPPKAGGFQRRF